MSNTLDASGLTINSVNDIINNLTVVLQDIYGTDINVDSNSPDGQMINIYAQADEDTLELLMEVYNSFSVQGAVGTVLDQRVALNGIARKQGTYTQTPVIITVNQALTLYGLDQTINPVFTVSDNAGNQYQLLTTTVFAGAGSLVLMFQAVAIGQVEVSPNTITNQITTVIGVTDVNNPNTNIITTANTHNTTPQITNIPSTTGMVVGMLVSGNGIPANSTIISVDSGTQITVSQNSTASNTGITLTVTMPPITLGVNEETDAQLKVRQVSSFALAATGPADAITAALLAIPDVTDAYIVENDANSIVDSVPAHGIWTIVNGGTSAEIAQAIYAKKGIGCDMKGSQSWSISRPNGSSFTALWDDAISQPLYIQLTINGKIPGTSFDMALIAKQLAEDLTYKLGQSPTIGDVITAMATIAPNGYVTGAGVSSDDISFFDVVAPSDAQHYYIVLASNIAVST